MDKSQEKKSKLEILKKRSIKSFSNYILKIRFPFFKKIKENSEIIFDFPFTVLVGPNGSGKSSTLHALYGCPASYVVSDFWFSTAIDPIKESGGQPYRYIYSYKPSGYHSPVEIIQKRVQRDKDPEYWETARPSTGDGMSQMPNKFSDELSAFRNKTRWKKISKEVVYIDFRAELSAFDKFFYFGKFTKTKSITSKQDFLRKRSEILKKHIRDFVRSNNTQSWHSKKTRSVESLSQEELGWVNHILGKNHISAQIISHDLFNSDGYSIIFSSGEDRYSEAVAGSGEVSVVNCVVKVLRAPKDSLILLDEPEVSLHPGAQKLLRELLLDSIIKKGCQVIMSTHSEHFVDGLPHNAIKLFQYDRPSKSYSIINNCSPEQAFLRLGSSASSGRKTIYVEDVLAREVLKEAIIEIDDQIISNVDIVVYPGGSDTLVKNLLIHFTASSKDNNVSVFLDGDMKRSVALPDSEVFEELNSQVRIRRKSDIPESELSSIDQIIHEQTGVNFADKIPLSSGGKDRGDDVEFKLNMLDTYHEKFHFMNVDTPEELIWRIATNTIFLDVDSIREKINEGDYKSRIRELSEIEYGKTTNSHQIFELQKRLLSTRDRQSLIWTELKESVKELLQAVDLSSA